MAKFVKRAVVVEASQWFKLGDHALVKYYPAPLADDKVCESCGRLGVDHGMIDTLEGLHFVCPGDWIITGVKGEHYPCKPDIFAETYEPITGLAATQVRTLAALPPGHHYKILEHLAESTEARLAEAERVLRRIAAAQQPHLAGHYARAFLTKEPSHEG